MTEVVLFHHAQGLTDGVVAFADKLRVEGHSVVLPDLYDGLTFDTLEAGVAHAEQIGFMAIAELGAAAPEVRTDDFVVAGFSLGILPAQKLAQSCQRVQGALLYHGCVPVTTFSDGWPDQVGLQMHYCEEDPWAEPEVVRELAAAVPHSEAFAYPGSAHLVADSSLTEYDPAIADQILARTLAFLASR